jgi:hypothetical protein
MVAGLIVMPVDLCTCIGLTSFKLTVGVFAKLFVYRSHRACWSQEAVCWGGGRLGSVIPL